jgi:hypothetical protein
MLEKEAITAQKGFFESYFATKLNFTVHKGELYYLLPVSSIQNMDNDSPIKSLFDKLNTILFRRLQDITTWVAGSFIPSYLAHDESFKSNDIDVYTDSTANFLSIVTALEDNGFEPSAETENSIKLTNGDITLDLVKLVFSGPVSCISRFDFTLVKAAMSRHSFVFHQFFFMDLAMRMINISKQSDNPYSSLFRIIKYTKRGFRVPESSMRKLLLMMGNIDESKLKMPKKTYF